MYMVQIDLLTGSQTCSQGSSYEPDLPTGESFIVCFSDVFPGEQGKDESPETVTGEDLKVEGELLHIHVGG